MIHLGSVPGQVAAMLRGGNFVATPSLGPGVGSFGSYDTISEAHAECLPANNLFVRFSPPPPTTVGSITGDSDEQVGEMETEW